MGNSVVTENQTSSKIKYTLPFFVNLPLKAHTLFNIQINYLFI